MNNKEYERVMDAAKAYNESIAAAGGGVSSFTPAQRTDYDSQLNIDGTGVMGYIEIQKIHISLPIYHGTSDSVLQIAIGHIEGSSLPVGGKSTHCVLSGHRGLPSARLFTDLDQMVEGDNFILRTMNETLTYEVDQIRIVLPEEVGDLQVVPGEDLCTLVTCTPYGVNTHRLLVRGHRVGNQPGVLAVTAEGIQIRPVVVMPILAAPVLLGLLAWALFSGGKKKTPREILNEYRRKRDENDK